MQHFAILELLKTKDCRHEPKWMARQLGIDTTEASAALQRLFRLGIIDEDEDGNWLVLEENLSTFSHEYTNGALKKLATSILERAITALDDIPFEVRSQSALTVAVNSDDIKEIKRRIDQFRREMNQFLESRKNKDSVYHFSFSFYPVTKPGDKK